MVAFANQQSQLDQQVITQGMQLAQVRQRLCLATTELQTIMLRHIAVFPMHVGMNRCLANQAWSSFRVPHARGDEPPL